MSNLQVIDQRNVMGREFSIYGDFENPLFLAKDVAGRIEHSDVSMMMKSIDETEKLTQTLFVSGQNREMWFLTEDGFMEVMFQSRKPIAKEFKKQVKAILKEIRKTGTYKIDNQQSKTTELEIKNKNAEARLKNSQTRQATFLLDQSKKYSHLLCKEAMSLLVVNALEMVAGKNTLPRPQIETNKYYSATEIGELAGVSSKKVGKVANANNMKTDEYGIMTLSQSQYSTKQIPSFIYNEAGKGKLLELLAVI